MPKPPAVWRTPEETLDIAVERSRLILMNEAHSGMRRSARTRRIGLRTIMRAHQAGVRHLAMEALQAGDAELANRTRQPPERGGYLRQPEMRDLIGCALDQGWELLAYEADLAKKPPEFASRSHEETNWREHEQANNLADLIHSLPKSAGLIVWCGNHHLAKSATDWWRPMGSRLTEMTGIEPFAIDQTLSVRFQSAPAIASAWVEEFAAQLDALGGTAGFLTEEAPEDWPDLGIADAYLLSTDNDLG